MTKTQQSPVPLPLALGLETTKEQAQIIAADGSHLAYVECDPAMEIATFIINACNAHNELIETVKTLPLPHMGDCRLEDERKARALVARITGKPQIGATVREEDKDENRTIKITVKSGMVQDVDGLPDGWDYEIDDQDGE